MIINIFRLGVDFHFSLANDYVRDSRSMGYQYKQDATAAAITSCLVRRLKIDFITGQADRKTCRAHNIKFRDRGNRTGSGAQERQQQKFHEKLQRRRELAAQTMPPFPAPVSLSVLQPLAPDAVPLPVRKVLSPAKLAALQAAREKRRIASARTAPPGYGSAEHLLETAREYCGAHLGSYNRLAAHLGVDESSVRRWLKREKMPLQRTLDAIALWLSSRKAQP